MARKRNYDDYGYDNDYAATTGGLVRKVIMIVMLLIAIILIIYLIKGCSNKPNKPDPVTPDPVIPNPVPDPEPDPKPEPEPEPEKFDYEVALLEAAKKHYNAKVEELPSIPGECAAVELRTLINEALLKADKFTKCNAEGTYVKVCVLENNVKQYSPWLKCNDYNSDSLYLTLRTGEMKDIKTDSTYVEFKFLPQAMTQTSGTTLGKVEEIWKDDIRYNSYKTLGSTKYYRYRDKLFIWELTTKSYYSRSGIKTNPNEVNDYYISSPSSGYTLKSDKTTNAYKWYRSSSSKEYYMVNGAKGLSQTAPSGYPIRDDGVDVVRYSTRTITGSYSPTKYYACSTSSTSTIIKYQKNKCGEGLSPEFNYQREVFYTCAEDIELVRTSPRVSANTTCHRYSEWSYPSTTPCNTNNTETCQKIIWTFYHWYRNVDDIRTYYPSGSSSASGEKVYYVSEPFKGAIKDTSSRATAYKWYNEKIKMSDTYSAVAPSGYTSGRRTSDYKWSNWSSWSTKYPTVTDGRERTIETKTKIKLQEIIGKTESAWQNIANEYLSEEEMIKVFKNKGYKVNNLEDIINNGQIKYQLKLFVRNKKGE